jgi:TolB-like protein
MYEFDRQVKELRKSGLRLKLQAKPAAVLSLLLNQPGQIVSTAQLREELWASDTFVDFEHSLGIAIWKLRSLLGDTAKNSRFIETIPRRGYRFIAPVREITSDGSATTKKMLAVLPFDDLRRSTSEDWFADGLTEELITQLGSLNPHRLGVIARSSTLRYKGSPRPLREIAFELGVRFILTGAVRRDKRRLRVTAQLIQASDQSPIWTGSYDRLVADIIDLQIELAEQIAKSLAVELLPEQQERIARSRTYSPQAHELYMQGRYNWNKRTSPATLAAIEYFKKAVAADAHYAPAYVGLADSFAVLGFLGDLAPTNAFKAAKEYALKALDIDQGLPEAHGVLAFCLLEYDWDWTAAERAHLDAIQANPNSASGYHWYGISLTQMGAFSEASRSLRRAIELDPFDVAIQTQIGRLCYFSRQCERALSELRHAVEQDGSYIPALYLQALTMLQAGDVKNAIIQLQNLTRVLHEHFFPLSGLAYAYGIAGKHTTAQRMLNRLYAISKSMRVPPYFFAVAEAGRRNSEKVLTFLEEAYTERFPWLFYLKMDPVFDFLRMDARFNDLMQRVQTQIRVVAR